MRAPTLPLPLGARTGGIGRSTAELRDQIVSQIGGYPGEAPFAWRSAEAVPQPGATFVDQARVPSETSNNFPFGVRRMLVPPPSDGVYLRLGVPDRRQFVIGRKIKPEEDGIGIVPLRLQHRRRYAPRAILV
jgi:hypothetical protein